MAAVRFHAVRRRLRRKSLRRPSAAALRVAARPEADVAIRPYRPGDESALYEAATETIRRAYPFLPWCRPGYTFQEAATYVERQTAAFAGGTQFDFVIESPDGRFLGACGLNQIDTVNRRANLGYWVRSSAMRRGVATRAVREVALWAFANTGLNRLEIVVSTRNAASLRVAEKAGAAREGLLRSRLLLHGRRHDAVMFAFVRGPGDRRRTPDGGAP
jgi:RimJ/RimL family protein N-acetyltransferase